MLNILVKPILESNKLQWKPCTFILSRSFAKKKSKLTFSETADVPIDQNVPGEPKPQKMLKVSIIGAPNAGKSSFINTLTNHRVSKMKSIH